jgi:D-alanyl-D-alanine dipeptidase
MKPERADPLAFAFLIAIAVTACADPLAEVQQLLLVVPSDWNAVSAHLVCFERTNSAAPWQKWGHTIPVVIGRGGLGWGRGLHPANGVDGPIKREGDGKSPAGIFRLTGAFGYEQPDSMKWIHLPYVQCGSALECVDDPKSSHYNATVERSKIGDKDWESSEHMRRTDDLYRLGIFVAHNQNPAVAGKGSCIFIHIWEGPTVGTSGCTAMAAERLTELLSWLEPTNNPVLVQLPKAEYLHWRFSWKLPEHSTENDTF